MIVGITGTYGAGKGTVVEDLLQQGFHHYSASGFITEEIERRGLPVNRDSMIFVANDLRKKHGSGYVIEQLMELAVKKGGNAIVESVRAIGEVDALEKAGGILLGVDADQSIRYKRAQQRGSVKDDVTLEVFKDQEAQEMKSDDPNKQNIGACMKRATYIIDNSGTREELDNEVKKFIQTLQS